MASKPSLSEDQFVDMTFITRLLGVSDKWIYQLIERWHISKTHQTGTKFPLVAKRSRSLATGPY